MTDWYRNASWDEDVAAAFDARLARSRSQKAQYLRIQGSMLKDTYPEAAVALLDRCIAEGDEFHIAHALLDKAHAFYRMGKLEAALDTLEEAIAQEERAPMFRTSAPFDFAFLVALHGCSERYDRALHLIEGRPRLLMVMEFEREATLALILSERGEADIAAKAARRALAAEEAPSGGIAVAPEVGRVPRYDHPVRDRLKTIAAQAGKLIAITS